MADAAGGCRRGRRRCARRRVLPGVRRAPRPLPVRHRRLVARPADRCHRRPPRGARPVPLVRRHRFRRRPHPRRPAALRLGRRRHDQPHHRRPGRRRPAGPLAAGRPARRGGHPRHRHRRPAAGRLRPRPVRRTPLEPRYLDARHRTPGRPGGLCLPRRHPRPAVVPARSARRPSAHRRPHRAGQTGAARRRPAGHHPADLRRRRGPAAAAAALRHPPHRARLHPVDRPRPRRGTTARPADRTAQPPVAPGAHLERARRRRTHRSAFRAHADRPRPLPFGQRHPRSPRGRPAAPPDRRAAAPRAAPRRRGRTARRRRVRRVTADRGLHDVRLPRRPQPRRRPQLPARPRRAHPRPGGQRRARGLPRPLHRRRGAAAPRRRGDVPGET